jgi:hypothetical protein
MCGETFILLASEGLTMLSVEQFRQISAQSG